MFIKHDLLKIPKNIRKETEKISLLGIITSIGFDLMSFFLQLGKEQISAGRTILGLILIAVYYCQNTLHTSTTLWMDDINATYREHYTLTINYKIVEILLKVRGKVWRTDKTGAKEVMSTNGVLLSSKNYLSMVWDFKTGIPKYVFQIVSVIAMFIGFVIITTVEIEHVFLFISIIVIVSILSCYFSIRRIKTKNRHREDKKENSEERDRAMNDVLNIEPLNQKHARYMADNYIKANKNIFAFDKKDRKDINKINFFESFIDSIATISIIAIKVYETGLSNVNLEVILSIVSLLAIYSQIMNRLNSIIHLVEDCKSQLEEIKVYSSDFSEILNVFDEENIIDNTSSHGNLASVEIPSFNVQYQATGSESPFTLVNHSNFSLLPNDIVLFTGPTGSGKSTLMQMITKMKKFDGFELKYNQTTNGNINSIMHQTDGRLGFKPILEELTFGEDVDSEKLLHILKGLHLYEEISERDTDVLRYLENAHIQNFSTGQKQRLAIARLLYNLDDSIQIIAFDEATNALNDEITLQTLGFIQQYCEGKILLIATHQVALGTTIANKTIEFIPNTDSYKVIYNA